MNAMEVWDRERTKITHKIVSVISKGAFYTEKCHATLNIQLKTDP